MAMLNNQIVHRIFQGSAFKKEMIPNSEDRSPYCFPILGAKPTTSFQAWFHWRRISGTLHLWESHSWVTGAASCHGIHAMLAVQRRRLSHDFARVSMIDRSWGIRNVATPMQWTQPGLRKLYAALRPLRSKNVYGFDVLWHEPVQFFTAGMAVDDLIKVCELHSFYACLEFPGNVMKKVKEKLGSTSPQGVVGKLPWILGRTLRLGYDLLQIC